MVKDVDPINQRAAESASLIENQQNQIREPDTIEERLSGDCIYLRDLIVWERATGERDMYDEWSDSQKDRLNELFQLLLDDRELGLDRPDPNRNISLRPKEPPCPLVYRCMFLTENQAFDIYAAHVAHVLFLEATDGVPWSIFTIPDVELAELLSSDRYHSRILPSSFQTSSNPYYPGHIMPNRDFQLPIRIIGAVGLICDPRVGYRFLHGDNSSTHQNIIGATDEETMKNLTFWFAENVVHSVSEELESEYMSQIITKYNFLEDRLKAVRVNSQDYRIVGNGCYSSANLFLDIARSVNIPIRYIFTRDGVGQHAGLAFRWGRDPRILYHIDDIYAMNFAPFFPVVEGRRATSLEAEWKYFNIHWNSPTDLESWGFRNTNNYSLIANPAAASGIDDIQNEVFFNCDWPRRNEPGLLLSQSWEAFLLEKKYQLGTWNNYLSIFCNIGFDEMVAQGRSATSRSLEEFREGARTCIGAYGGCENLRELSQYWQSRQNTWIGTITHDKSDLSPRVHRDLKKKHIPPVRKKPRPKLPK